MSQPWRGQIASKVASGSRVKITGQFSRWRRSNHSLWSGGSWTAWNNPPQTHSICQKCAKPGSKANSWFFSRSCGWRRGSVNKNHLIEPPLPPLPATDYTGLKSFFYCQQKKKCFPWRQLSALRPPLASTCSLSLDEQHAGQSGGRGEDERRRRHTDGEKGKRGRGCEDEECEAATRGGNIEEKRSSQLRHRLFNCPACHSLQGFISSSPTLGANELLYSVLLSVHLLSSILLSISPPPPVVFFFYPLLNH